MVTQKNHHSEMVLLNNEACFVRLMRYVNQKYALFDYSDELGTLILFYLFYPPQTLFVGGILFSRCPSVRLSVRACVRASVRNALFP